MLDATITGGDPGPNADHAGRQLLALLVLQLPMLLALVPLKLLLKSCYQVLSNMNEGVDHGID